MTPNREDLSAELRSLIAEIAEVDPEAIGPETQFMAELDMDSLMALELLAALEIQYGIKIPEEALPSMTRLLGVVAVVSSQLEAVRA